MSVKRDINLGTLIPIALFLIVQTGGGIWWASSIHSTVTQVTASHAKHVSDADSENLRQWARISAVETALTAVSSTAETTAALLARIEADVDAVSEDIKETNNLIRDLLLKQAIQDRRTSNGQE